MDKKRLTPILPYLGVWAGLFVFESAWLALIGFHFAILAALILFRPDISPTLLFKSKHRRWVFTSVFLCGLSGVGLYFFWDLFHISNALPESLKKIGLSRRTWTVFIVYFSLVNPFIEEYFWRGFLSSPAKHVHVGDFIFAGYHMLILWNIVPPLSMFFAFILLATSGWLWRQIHREDEGLLAPALGHIAADFSILACVYLKVYS